MSDDRERLAGYLTSWESAAVDVIGLLRSLTPEDWSRQTDLPGWDVRCVAAHLAHLESELAGNPQPEVEVVEAEHIRNAFGVFTERGPLARAAWTTEQIVDELDHSVAVRAERLKAEPPDDLSATADRYAAVVGWSWDTLLSNRVVDVWMHGQDIRRAVGRPGALDGPAAEYVAGLFARSLPYVVGKRVAPPAGTSVVVRVTGEQSFARAVTMASDGRARGVDPVPADPTTSVRLAFADFAVLSGGRRLPAAVEVDIAGDRDLGMAVLGALALTP